MSEFKKCLFTIVLLSSVMLSPMQVFSQDQYRLGVLMAGDFRLPSLNGLKDGMASYGVSTRYEISNAKGNRKQLAGLAQQIIKSKPSVAIAAGGVEADALFEASKGTNIPVVFLAVSSSVDRGLVHSMNRSQNNLTGIETNDTELTEKRLWFIRKIMPQAKHVLMFKVPSIIPSVKSVEIAKQLVSSLGFKLNVLTVENKSNIIAGLKTVSKANADIILLAPAAPVNRIIKSHILPFSIQHEIPVFGYGMGMIKRGATISFAGSRYKEGFQASRLVNKILGGESPRHIPVETPKELEFIINRWMVNRLGLKVPRRIWRIANTVVDIAVYLP
ncbi:MAG: ABC transporter substrate-binding protein [Methylococcales bacterium]|jgi:putative tryptophan/tyrosine transport system substrate-binding protein|nr:ABC transporter substrate-binding protein [Methylococcales bacterium]